MIRIKEENETLVICPRHPFIGNWAKAGPQAVCLWAWLLPTVPPSSVTLCLQWCQLEPSCAHGLCAVTSCLCIMCPECCNPQLVSVNYHGVGIQKPFSEPPVCEELHNFHYLVIFRFWYLKEICYLDIQFNVVISYSKSHIWNRSHGRLQCIFRYYFRYIGEKININLKAF